MCCPSRATVLTGKYPHNHGITGNYPPDGGEPEFRSSGQDQDTVATRAQAAGYRTALIGKYMNGYAGEYEPPGWSYWYAQAGMSTVNDNGRMVDSSGSFPVTIANKAQVFLDHATDQAGDPPFMLFYWTLPAAPARFSRPRATATSSRDAKLPRAPSFNEADVSDKPAYIKNLPSLTQDQIDQLEKAGHETQLRTLAHVDDTLKNMLDLLEESGPVGKHICCVRHGRRGAHGRASLHGTQRLEVYPLRGGRLDTAHDPWTKRARTAWCDAKLVANNDYDAGLPL